MSRGPNKAIALMRSATMPTVPGLKREASEAPSLSSVPAADSQSLEANRGGVLKSKRFFQREVDLSSLVPEANANIRAKKQAIIDAELKEAISALKKPNRELAGKSLAETAEKRSASASHSRSEWKIYLSS
jgi:DNA replication regulator SLD3